MTDIPTGRPAGSVFSRLAARIGRRQRELSDRVHANRDAFARDAGWCVVPVTGRFGFGGRIYRDRDLTGSAQSTAG